MRKRLGLIWHSLRYRSNQIIFQDCLCTDMKAEIKQKIDYHTAKIRELEALK